MIKKNVGKRVFTTAIAGTMLLGSTVCNVSAEEAFSAYDEEVKVEIGTICINPSQMGEIPDGGNWESNAVMNYAQELLNVDIDYTFETTDDYSRTVSLAIASGELPDLMVVNSIDMLDELVENDMVADLTDVWETYASDHLKADYAEAMEYDWDVLSYGTYDGKLMALPRNSVAEPENVIFIRQDWMDALGIKVDEDGNKIISREELEMVAQAFIENDPGNSGNPVGLAIEATMSPVADHSTATVNSSFGVHHRYYFQNEDGSVYSGSTVPEAKEALAWWKDMYDKGILDPQFGTRNWDNITELLVNGQLGIFFGESSITAWGITNVYETDPNAVFSAYGLDDGTGSHLTCHYPVINRWLVVRKDYEHPEVAVKLLSIQNMLQQHYLEMTDTNEVLDEYAALNLTARFDLLGLVNDRPDVAFYRYLEYEAYKNGEITEEEFTSASTSKLVDVMERAEEDYASLAVGEKGEYYGYQYKVGEAIATWNEDGTHKFATPILVRTTETMETRLADLNKFEEETWVKIITGEEPLDYFDEYVEEYNALGGTAIEEELAAALK